MIGSQIIMIGALILQALAPAPERVETLSDAAMAELVGGDGCKNCHYAPDRFDECLHYTQSDICQTSVCIANYLIESTCDLGAGTCTAYSDTYAAGYVQYARMDYYCSTSNPTQWLIYTTHYYGPNCTAAPQFMRCNKPTNNCNGTLVGSATRYPGISCQ
ncbi:MAG TPA: hypothetical protein PLG73_10425 [Candidatus Sumerlaeota bacterium]|nr:hypothetical protein [Candidatus Sumerlaeota bacterium]